MAGGTPLSDLRIGQYPKRRGNASAPPDQHRRRQIQRAPIGQEQLGG